MNRRSRKRLSCSISTITMILIMVSTCMLIVLPAGAAGIDQYFPPYPVSIDGSWPVIRHDPSNSDFSQNCLDPDLNYSASMEYAWREIDEGTYPPVRGETPAEDTGGLDDVTHFAGSVLDQTCEWRRLDSQGEEVAHGTGVFITTVSKGYPNGVPDGSIGAPHVIAYGTDGTLLWTSDEWINDPDNWIDEVGDEYDDFNSNPLSDDYISSDSQKLPSPSLISTSVLLDDQHRIFVADEKYMWAANAADGDLIWKWRMPADDPYDPISQTGSGVSTPFATAFFTVNGEVGGVHLSGRVTVFPAIETQKHGVIPGAYGATYLPDGYKSLTEIYGRESHDPAPSGFFDMTEILWYPGKVDGEIVYSDEHPELWMIDPLLVEKALTGFAGTSMPVTNTPAVCPDPFDQDVTRIFVPILIDSYMGEGDTAKQDARLMRVDYRAGSEPELWEPWENGDEDPKGLIPGGNGSATSPDLSESGTGIFIVDQNGSDSRLYGFSTETGDLLWDPVRVGSMFGSTLTTWDGDNEPADPENGIDEDDLIYIQAEGKLIEVKQHSGEGGDLDNPALDFNMPTSDDGDPWIRDLYRVDSDGDGLEDILMPSINGQQPKAMISCVPVGSRPLDEDGLPDDSKLDLIFPLAVGYRIISGTPESLWPIKVMLIVARRSEQEDGTVSWNLIRLADLKDTCETSSFPDASGNIWISHIGTQSSVANGFKDKYPRILARMGWGRLLLPQNDYLAPVEPSGGVTRLDVITTPPEVTGMKPSSGRRGCSVTVTVRGDDFTANPDVLLIHQESEWEIAPVSMKAISRTGIVCRFDLWRAPLGEYDLMVTNPDGQSGILVDAFTVDRP